MTAGSYGGRYLCCNHPGGCSREFSVPDEALPGPEGTVFGQLRSLARAEGWQTSLDPDAGGMIRYTDRFDYCPQHRTDGMAGDAPADAWDLPPTQALILEVLGARFRGGDRTWPFPSKYGRSLRALEDAGLIGLQRGFDPRTLCAWLTGKGKERVLKRSYVTPAASLVEESLRLWNEGASPSDHRVDSWTGRARSFLRVFLEGGL